jgi:hypothetical protein
LAPLIDVAAFDAVSARTSYDLHKEREAETLATLILSGSGSEHPAVCTQDRVEDIFG